MDLLVSLPPSRLTWRPKLSLPTVSFNTPRYDDVRVPKSRSDPPAGVHVCRGRGGGDERGGAGAVATPPTAAVAAAAAPTDRTQGDALALPLSTCAAHATRRARVNYRFDLLSHSHARALACLLSRARSCDATPLRWRRRRWRGGGDDARDGA